MAATADGVLPAGMQPSSGGLWASAPLLTGWAGQADEAAAGRLGLNSIWSVGAVRFLSIRFRNIQLSGGNRKRLGLPAQIRRDHQIVCRVAATVRLSCAAVAGCLLLIPLATGCRVTEVQRSKTGQRPVMYDCQFQNNRHLHLHISEQRGSASLITAYQPGKFDSHADDVRQGRESEGLLVPSAPGSRYTVELFLLNDHFGESPGEKVLIRMAPDGRSRLEAQKPGGRARTIDFGTCSPKSMGR